MSHDHPGGEAKVPPPFLLKLITPLIWLGGAISAVLILIMLAVTIYAIVMRYAVNAPLLWADEVTGWSLVAIVMLGAAEAYRRGDHIAIDLVAGQLSKKARAVQEVWAHLAVLAFSVVLGLSAWESVTFAYDFGAYTSGNVEIAIWIPQSPMILGSFLLGLIAFSRILEVVMNRSAR